MSFSPIGESESDVTDRDAILLMLSYVEAECRRLGALEAARHAAMAAALVPEPALAAAVAEAMADAMAGAAPQAGRLPAVARRGRLH